MSLDKFVINGVFCLFWFVFYFGGFFCCCCYYTRLLWLDFLSAWNLQKQCVFIFLLYRASSLQKNGFLLLLFFFFFIYCRLVFIPYNLQSPVPHAKNLLGMHSQKPDTCHCSFSSPFFFCGADVFLALGLVCNPSLQLIPVFIQQTFHCDLLVTSFVLGQKTKKMKGD